METFLIASNNPKKLKELSRILSPLNICAKTALQAGFTLPEVAETGATFAQNAKLKAQSAYNLTGMPSVADDSGLVVDALNGQPGIYSARYAGEKATDAQNMEKLLKELVKLPMEQRTARFVCSVCCILHDQTVLEVSGECKGHIAFAPVGNGGFGYDPIFLIKDGRSFAQLSASEKDAIIHRGNALRKLEEALKKYYK